MVTSYTRVVALPLVVAAIMTLTGCPTPEIDTRVPGLPMAYDSSHHRPPDR